MVVVVMKGIIKTVLLILHGREKLKRWENWRRRRLEEEGPDQKIKVDLRMIFQLRLKFDVVACYGKVSFWFRTLFFFLLLFPSTFAPHFSVWS